MPTSETYRNNVRFIELFFNKFCGVTANIGVWNPQKHDPKRCTFLEIFHALLILMEEGIVNEIEDAYKN